MATPAGVEPPDPGGCAKRRATKKAGGCAKRRATEKVRVAAKLIFED